MRSPSTSIRHATDRKFSAASAVITPEQATGARNAVGRWCRDHEHGADVAMELLDELGLVQR